MVELSNITYTLLIALVVLDSILLIYMLNDKKEINKSGDKNGRTKNRR